jgi:hypothetical protein
MQLPLPDFRSSPSEDGFGTGKNAAAAVEASSSVDPPTSRLGLARILGLDTDPDAGEASLWGRPAGGNIEIDPAHAATWGEGGKGLC